MTAVNHRIAEYLDYYTSLTNPQFAVLINGRWGSGKTWFIKDYFQDDQTKKFLYVSLFGAASTSEIAERIFVAMHPILTSRGVAIAGRLVKGVVKATFSVNMNEDKDSELKITPELPSIADTSDLVREKSSIGNRVLILDDLERCSVGGKELWGYINRFVEHEGSRVIILSSESEVDDSDYRRIKEKSVGMTLSLQPDVAATFTTLLETDKGTAATESLEIHQSRILQIFSASTYQNLRLLRFAIRDYRRVFSETPTELQRRREVEEYLINTTMILAIETYSGSIKAEQITDLFGAWVRATSSHSTTDPEESHLAAIIEKYESTTGTLGWTAELEWWSAFFSSGIVDTQTLHETLSKRFKDAKGEPDWLKLASYTWLSDQTFSCLLKTTEEQLTAEKFDSVGPILHITAVQLWASANNLSQHNADDIRTAAKQAIDRLAPEELFEGQTEHGEFFEMTGHAGIGYASTKHPHFVELLSYVQSARDELANSHARLIANNALKAVAIGGSAFEGEIIENSSRLHKAALRKPILSFIDAEKFAAIVSQHSMGERKQALYALHNRLRKHMPEEASWAQEVVGHLKKGEPSLQRLMTRKYLESILTET